MKIFFRNKISVFFSYYNFSLYLLIICHIRNKTVNIALYFPNFCRKNHFYDSNYIRFRKSPRKFLNLFYQVVLGNGQIIMHIFASASRKTSVCKAKINNLESYGRQGLNFGSKEFSWWLWHVSQIWIRIFSEKPRKNGWISSLGCCLTSKGHWFNYY